MAWFSSLQSVFLFYLQKKRIWTLDPPSPQITKGGPYCGRRKLWVTYQNIYYCLTGWRCGGFITLLQFPSATRRGSILLNFLSSLTFPSFFLSFLSGNKLTRHAISSWERSLSYLFCIEITRVHNSESLNKYLLLSILQTQCWVRLKQQIWIHYFLESRNDQSYRRDTAYL